MKNQPTQPAAQDADGDRPELTERQGLPGAECLADTEVATRRLLEERDEALANWKRSQADYQNLRRRVQSDIDAAVQRSKQALLADLLLVLDYLEMALSTPVTTDEDQNLLAGVEMTRTTLLRALERENVRPFPAEGTFDPAFHEAVESVATSDKPPGTILATLRRGYTVGGQGLRPAQVRVAVAPSTKDSGQRNDAAERDEED